MGRLFLLVGTVFVLTGCSELQVVTGAAMRELRADVIAVAPAQEMAQAIPTKERREPERLILMAKADWRPTDWRYGETQTHERKKGLWEVN